MPLRLLLERRGTAASEFREGGGAQAGHRTPGRLLRTAALGSDAASQVGLPRPSTGVCPCALVVSVACLFSGELGS